MHGHTTIWHIRNLINWVHPQSDTLISTLRSIIQSRTANWDLMTTPSVDRSFAFVACKNTHGNQSFSTWHLMLSGTGIWGIRRCCTFACNILRTIRTRVHLFTHNFKKIPEKSFREISHLKVWARKIRGGSVLSATPTVCLPPPPKKKIKPAAPGYNDPW